MKSITISAYGLALLTVFVEQSSALCLGTCAQFGAICSTTLSNAGATSITGKCGVSPAGAVTGAPGCSLGTETNTVTSAKCRTDCGTAYTNGFALAGGTPNSGVLGGQTLTPGVYDIAAGATIGAGTTLTLNLLTATSTSDQFIFRITSTLVTGIGAQVVLGAGVQACNVYFLVGSSATLAASTVLKGNVLALTSITVGKNVNVAGLLCARNAAISLDTDTIVAQSCCRCPAV
jgi:hypothetical protein